ncbi:MAG: non-ribosomal peptide synthetase, partial [Pyrinomonadaceae bacterium]
MLKEILHGFRLSPYQKHLWLLQQGDQEVPYLCQIAVLIDGNLDSGRLLGAIAEAVQRHEILRTNFQCVQSMKIPLQVVADGKIEWAEQHDLSAWNPQEQWEQIHLLFDAERRASIDLERGTLLRASLVCLSSKKYVLMLSAPALCTDRKSLDKLVREVGWFYGRPPQARDDSGELLQYADFSAWHNELLEASADIDSAFWVAQRLPEGSEPMFPYEKHANGEASFTPQVLREQLRSEIARDIETLCVEHRFPLDRFFLGCWAAFLSRVTGCDKIVIGTVADFHQYQELEQTLGPLTSYLPLKVALDQHQRLGDLIEEIGHSLEEMSARQEYFAWEETNGRKGRLSTSPALSYCFDFVGEPSRFDVADLAFSICEDYACIGDFKLNLACVHRGNSLTVEFHYDGDALSPEHVEHIAAQFHRLLESVRCNFDSRIADLDILTDADRHHLLVDFNRTDAAFPADQCVHQLFEQQADCTPDAIAVAFEDRCMSYAELNGRANQIAHYLRRLGIGPEALVPVCVNRSCEMMVGILGVMKTGAAYVPLDPSDPAERLKLLLENLQAPILLTRKSLAGRFDGSALTIIDLGDTDQLAHEPTANLASGVRPQNLAYVIYTSGSTGQPKGVMITHEGLVNYLHWCTRAYDMQGGRGSIVHSGFGFDLTVTSLFAPLLVGQSVLLLPEDGGFGVLPAALRNEGDFSFIKTTPGQVQVLNQTMSPDELAGRTHVLILGGEQLQSEDVSSWRARAPQTRLINEYGPTETVVGCCCYEIPTDAPITGAVPIGRPIANTQIYLLDQRLQPVPVGVPGKLYVGGTSVGRGYFNEPALTAEKFIPNPFGTEPGARLYNTGDLARLRSDENIEFLGRTDFQVKIRGYRVEIAEVEQALAEHPMVRQSVVIAKDDGLGATRLVAYIVPDSQDSAHVKAAELRSFLGRKLPEHMLPTAFVLLKAIPLTASGKVDRQALPDGESGRPELGYDYTAPRTLEEEVLAGIWSEVLKIEQVGIDDNYFVLGGDSIRSLQVVARARKRGLNFSIDRLFSHPTIRDLAQSLRASNSASAPVPTTLPFSLISERDRLKMPPDVEDAYPLTMLQGGMLFHRASSPESSIYHDIFSLHLKARLDVDVLSIVIQQLISRHPVLRTSFDISNFSEPVQLVHRTSCVPLELEDLRHLPPELQDQRVSAWILEDKARGFDPSGFPLVRFHVHMRSEQSFQFSGSFHHAIIDGWSDAVMVTEIFEHYFSVLSGEAIDLKPTTSSFRDFVVLEREALQSQEHQRYWNEKLSGFTLSAVPRRQSDQALISAPRVVTQIEVPLADEVSEGLKKFALSTTVPLKSVLLAAHLRVLSVISGQLDVLTCVVSSGRLEHMDGERVLGLFLNSVPFPANLSGGSWKDLVLQTFEAEQEMLPFRRYPMAELKRRQNAQPLSETLFYFTNYHVYQSLQRFDAELLGSSFYEESSFPLIANFRLDPFTSKLFLDLQGDQRYLSREQLEGIGGYYQRALGALAEDAGGRYELVSLLSELEEREQV